MTTTATRPSKLAITAYAMRNFITETGARYSHQRLARGLEIVLSRTVEDTGAHKWRLAIARADVEPSADEVAICRRDFQVPDGSEETRTTKARTNDKSRVTTVWHVVEVLWYEAQ